MYESKVHLFTLWDEETDRIRLSKLTPERGSRWLHSGRPCTVRAASDVVEVGYAPEDPTAHPYFPQGRSQAGFIRRDHWVKGVREGTITPAPEA
jgi:hypothetical protein